MMFEVIQRGEVMSKRLKLVCFAFLALVTISGCERKPTHDEVRVAKAAAKPFAVQEIRFGNGGDKPDPQTTKAPIRVTITTTGKAAAGAQLNAKLFNLKQGRAVGEQSRQLKEENAKVEFVFSNANGFEPGRYLLELMLNGKLLGHRELDVFDSPEAPSPDRS